MDEQLLHGDVVLMVRGELGNDVRHEFLLAQLLLLNEQPGGRRSNRLSSRKDAEQRLVVGRADGLEQQQSSVPGQRDLRRRQKPVVHLLANPRQEGGDPQWVDPVVLRISQPAVLQISRSHRSWCFLSGPKAAMISHGNFRIQSDPD